MISTEIHPFDLQARAELAVHGLTALLDPERPGVMYFLANWRTRPPRADHGLWDCGDGSGRHVDALTLLRTMVRAGSAAALPTPAEAQIESWMLRLIGDDGLSWLPDEPWAAPWGPGILLAADEAGSYTQPGERFAEISWAQRGTLMGLTSRYLASGDERYLAKARALVDGLLRVALVHPDGLYFPEGYYRSGGWRTQQLGLHRGIEENNAVTIGPALRLYQVCGYEPALELGEGLARFVLKHTQGYGPDGGLQAEPGNGVQVHFHSRSCTILGVLKLGLVLGRREYVAWARQTYEAAKRWGTEFGWFPEGIGQRHAEICCTTDMIEAALLLGQHVDRRYYADAERFGRNHLLESQWLSLDRLEAALERLPAEEQDPPWGGQYSTDARVAERQVGAWASRPAINDGFHTDATWLMQCCNAAGARGLYDIWRYSVEEAAGEGEETPHIAVNLRFSVETPLVRVVSHEPAEGRLDITVRRAARVQVRLPDGETQGWVIPGHSDAGSRMLQARDGYISFDAAAGECITLHYPLREWSARYAVGSSGTRASCVGHWRGETLMAVEPTGSYHPLYGRDPDLVPVEPGMPASVAIESL